MGADNFLKNLTAGFPTTLKSGESENVYHLIAEKDGVKMGVSAVLEPGYPAKYKGGKVLSIALVLRVIVDAETNPFQSFKTRQGAKFIAPSGDAVHGLRADKLYLPVTYWPVGPAELMQAINDQKVYDRLTAYIKGRVEADGGKMLFSDATVAQALASKFEDVPTDTLHLFALPGEGESPETDVDAVQSFKDSAPAAPDTPKLAAPAEPKKDEPSDGPNILPGGDTDPNADPDDEQ